MALVGAPGHGKSHMMKEIKSKLEPHQYRVAAPTHKLMETLYIHYSILIHIVVLILNQQ